MKIKLRGKLQSDADALCREGNPLEAFREVLNIADHVEPEPIISWEGTDQLAALDIDFASIRRDDELMLQSARTMASQPDWYWITHGGGYRGIFGPVPPFTADERAALFAWQVRGRFFGASPKGVEIKHDTRHPKYPRGGYRCSDVKAGAGFDAGSAAAALVGDEDEADDSRVDEWLESKGLRRFDRRPGSECPIAGPHEGKGDPVVYLDRGVYCPVCDAKSGRGFLAYCRLINPGRPLPNLLRIAARCRTHWDHAQHIVADVIGETGKLGRLIYRALLKLAHHKPGDTPGQTEAIAKLLDKVFFPEIPFIRGRGLWKHPDLLGDYPSRNTSAILAAMPACRFVGVDKKGNLGEQVDAVRRDFFNLNGNLANYGYPTVAPIRGIDFAWDKAAGGRAVASDWRVIRVARRVDPPFQPRDLAGLPGAEAHICRHFPGVDLALIRLLMGGKAISQLDPSEPPFLMLTGASGAAKSAHVLLAAELCCDGVKTLTMSRCNDDFKRKIDEGSEAFAFIDEVAKDPKIDTYLAKQLLSLKRGATYHKLYHGPTPMSLLPVVVLADTVVPAVMRDDVQLARRIVYHDFGAGVTETGLDWRNTCGSAGDLQGWRAFSEENAIAADTLVTSVMRDVEPNFIRLASRLGFQLMRAVETGNDAARRALFEAACKTPDADHPRWPGRGYKLIDLEKDENTPLAKAFLEVAGVGRDAFDAAALQEIHGAQWGVLLGIPGVHVDFRHRGRKAVIRFYRGRGDQRVFNEELRENKLEPVASLPDRSGNAVDSRPVESRSGSVPFASINPATLPRCED